MQNSLGTVDFEFAVELVGERIANLSIAAGSRRRVLLPWGERRIGSLRPAPINDTVTARFSRQLTRTVNGTISGGYARNQALAIPGFGIFNQNYDYAFAGASVSRPLGRTLNLFLSYQAQYQFSNVAFCVGVTCGTSVVAHLISVGLHWQARPMLVLGEN